MSATLATLLMFAAAEESRWESAAPALPTAQISGSTEPRGEVKAGLSVARVKGTTYALLTPFMSASLSSGSANLVEISRKKAAVSDGALGFHAAFLVGTTPDVPQDVISRGKVRAVDKCVEICRAGSADKACSSLLDKFKGAAIVKEIADEEKAIAAAVVDERILRAKLEPELDRLRRRELDARRVVLDLRESPTSARLAADFQARLAEAENAVERARLDLERADLLEFTDTAAQEAAKALHVVAAKLSVSRGRIAQWRAEIAEAKATPPTDPEKARIDNSALCEAGRELFWEDLKQRVRVTANLAPHFISIGAQVGARNQKFVQGTGVVDGADSPPFAEVKRLSFTSKAAFSYAHIWPQATSRPAAGYVELMAGHSYGRTPSDLSVKWCEPVGDGHSTIVGGDVTGVGQICAEAPWGRPQPAHRLALGLWGGALETNTGWWRVGAGARYDAVFQPTKINSALSIEVPLYFNVLRADPKKEPKNISYKGLIRVAPRVTGQWVPGVGLQSSFLLSIDLLAQRSIFLNALDWM